MSKRYLSREETAEYCGLGLSTLNNLACAGGGPLYVKLNGRVIYDVQDVDEWLASFKVDPATRRKPAASAEAPRPTVKRGRGRPAKQAVGV